MPFTSIAKKDLLNSCQDHILCKCLAKNLSLAFLDKVNRSKKVIFGYYMVYGLVGFCVGPLVKS